MSRVYNGPQPEEKLPWWYHRERVRLEELKTQLSPHKKQIDHIIGILRCFRDLSQLWHVLQMNEFVLHSPPLTSEAEEALEGASIQYEQLKDKFWQQLSLDFSTLCKSCLSSCLLLTHRTKVLLAPLFDLNDEFCIEPGELYQVAWENSSWHKMDEKIEDAKSNPKLLTAHAESGDMPIQLDINLLD